MPDRRRSLSSSARWSSLSPSQKLSRLMAYHPDCASVAIRVMDAMWEAQAPNRPSVPVAYAPAESRAKAGVSVARPSRLHR